MGSRHHRKKGLSFLGLALALIAPLGATAACDPETVDLRGPFGVARFSVELADDQQERAQGLMFRDHLPSSAGMLFVYEREQQMTFWMRNTYIPLDMLFIDATGTVRYIHHEARPRDETPIPGGRGLAVLEVNGGLARRLGIGVGAQVRHPAFADGPPVWPCD